jgi:hypothetical protein
MADAMGLIPVKTAPLASELPPAALADLMRGIIGDGPAAPFNGTVAPGGFVITRLKEFRSTSMPVLRGSLVAAPGGGTSVRLRLHPPRIVFLFMGIWLGFLAAVAALILASRAQDPDRSLLPLLAPAALAAFTWFLMVSVFDADARWALDRLLEALPALRRDGPPGAGEPVRPVEHL